MDITSKKGAVEPTRLWYTLYPPDQNDLNIVYNFFFSVFCMYVYIDSAVDTD